MAMLHLESAEPIVYDPPAEMVRDVSEADDLILPVVEPPAAVIIALANRVSRSELPEPLIEEAAPVATLESRRMKRRWFAGVDTNEVNELVVVSRSTIRLRSIRRLPSRTCWILVIRMWCVWPVI